MSELAGMLSSPRAADRLEAALSLLKQPQAELLADLVPLLKDPEEEVAWAASVAMAMSREPQGVERALTTWRARGQFPGARPHLERHARYISVVLLSLPRMGRTLQDEDFRLLENLGLAGIKTLISALGGQEREVRQASLEAMARMGGSWALKPLAASLGHADEATRAAAARSLVQVFERTRPLEGEAYLEAARGVLGCFQGDPSQAVRGAAAEALGATGDGRVYDLLVGGVRSGPGPLRTGSIRGLGRLGDARAVGLLSAGLQDAELRVVCLEAIGRLPGGDSTALLLRALDAAVVRGWSDLEQVAARSIAQRLEQVRALAENGADPSLSQAAQRALLRC